MIPLKRMAKRGTMCLHPTLTKCGLDLDEDNFQASPLSFFSTPVLIIDRKLETKHGELHRFSGLAPVVYFRFYQLRYVTAPRQFAIKCICSHGMET